MNKNEVLACHRYQTQEEDVIVKHVGEKTVVYQTIAGLTGMTTIKMFLEYAVKRVNRWRAPFPWVHHAHQCEGCGFIWDHVEVKEAFYAKGHSCPMCNKDERTCYGGEAPSLAYYDGEKLELYPS